MTKRKLIAVGVVAVMSTLAIGTFTIGHAWWGKVDGSSTEEVITDAIEVNWEDLVPDDYQPPENPLAEMSRDEIDKLFDGSQESKDQLEEIETLMSYAPTVAGLDGQRVKIPGYVVPLGFDGQTELSEFLLVPYYGACIHTPPPPANQVVHAKPEASIIIENTYDPVYAIGVIRTETTTSDLAESGYTLEIERVVPYEPKE